MILCERFPSLNPFTIRQIRCREIFVFMERFGQYIDRDREENGEIIIRNGKKVIRRKARDDWF